MASREIPLRVECDARYHGMIEGDGLHRTCERCETPVHDLSARTAEEARAFLAENPTACIRYLHDEGRVVHTNRPPSTLPAAWLVRARRTALIAATLTSAALVEACGPAPLDCHLNECGA